MKHRYGTAEGTPQGGNAPAPGRRAVALRSYLGDTEVISTRARVEIGLRVLVILEVLDLHFVVKHRHVTGSSGGLSPRRPTTSLDGVTSRAPAPAGRCHHAPVQERSLPAHTTAQLLA